MFRIGYTFTGREYDSETGLYHFRSRYYHAQLGRFVSRDPIGYWDSMNLYAYVGGNPTTYVDPLGLFLFDFEGARRRRASAWDDPNAFLDNVQRRGGTLRAGMAPKQISPEAAQAIGRDAEFATEMTVGLVADAASDAYEAVTGRTVMQRRLSGTERVMAAACVFIPADEVVKFGRKWFRRADRAPEPEITLWKGPAHEAGPGTWAGGELVPREPLKEVEQGFDPDLYPGRGPFFGLGDAGRKEAESWEAYYKNGLQEFHMPKPLYDDLVEQGIIMPDPFLSPGVSIHVPPQGLPAFNNAILQGTPNVYHPPKK